ncbi:MAG: hypothetical protein AB7E73_02485 [Burkholderiales bacterium]
MRNLLVILAMALLSATAQAQILKCIGAGGRVEFAAACPPGTKAESTGIRNNPGAASAGQQKSLAERDAEFRKRRLEQQESAKKSEEKSQENADRKQNCDSAQAYLRGLQSGQRVAKTDPKTGERVFLEDADRAAETARAQRAVESNCK